MAMDPLRRVANLWNWLPAFRVVAEYENIQKAAAVLSVSPSALSRTVKLLEEATNEALFVRSAAGLTLTAFGAELLRGARDGMRRIDDVMSKAQSRTGWERVLVSGASGPILMRLLDRALCAGVRDVEGVCYKAISLDEGNVVAELLRGNLDLALIEGGASFEPPEELSCVRVGELELALLTPPTHALADSEGEVDPASLEAAQIVALSGSPIDRSARVIATVASMEMAENLARQGPFLAFLPPVLAPQTFRVVARSSASVGVLAVFRTPLGGDEAPGLVRGVVERLGRVIAGT